LAPQVLWQAFEQGQDWHGMNHEARVDQEFIVGNGKRILINSPKIRYTPEQRLADMDSDGTDVQVVSIHTPLFPYHWDTTAAIQASREVNDEIAGMTKQWPDRFAGLATLPLQDVDASIQELERAVKDLGLKGAELDMVVNGLNWDEPRFLPLFKAAEELGALLFFHPQPQDNIVAVERTLRYGIPNSVGVVLEDALVVATLICGGILEECPNLRVCIAHGGGGACFAMGRIDHGWQVRSEARVNILKPPSAYQNQIYYDFLTSSEVGLRFLIDTVGADHVVVGSDWPFVGWDPSPGGWLEGLQSLTQEEKEKISWRNLETMLGI
jgi:aminocarboxymuconate-semialdehyde decarboxylase